MPNFYANLNASRTAARFEATYAADLIIKIETRDYCEKHMEQNVLGPMMWKKFPETAGLSLARAAKRFGVLRYMQMAQALINDRAVTNNLLYDVFQKTGLRIIPSPAGYRIADAGCYKISHETYASYDEAINFIDQQLGKLLIQNPCYY